MSITPPLELEVVYDLRCSSQQASNKATISRLFGLSNPWDAEENVTWRRCPFGLIKVTLPVCVTLFPHETRSANFMFFCSPSRNSSHSSQSGFYLRNLASPLHRVTGLSQLPLESKVNSSLLGPFAGRKMVLFSKKKGQAKPHFCQSVSISAVWNNQRTTLSVFNCSNPELSIKIQLTGAIISL